jgi:hypothetical protein
MNLKMAIPIAVLASTFAFAQEPERKDIRLHTQFATVVPGEVITITGKQQFNVGQSQFLRLFLGETEMSTSIKDADTLKATVPDIPSGTHQLRLVKHEGTPGRDKVLFSSALRVESSPPVEVARGAVTVTPENSTLTVEGIKVRVADPAANAGLTVAATIVQSEYDRRVLLGDLARQYNRLLVSIEAVEISVTRSITDRLLIDAPLPPDLASQLQSGDQVEVFAFVPGCHDYEHRPLAASWDPTTFTISVDLFNAAFATPDTECDDEVAEVAATSTPIKKALLKFAIVNKKQPACGIVKGQLESPTQPVLTVSSGDVVPLNGVF